MTWITGNQVAERMKQKSEIGGGGGAGIKPGNNISLKLISLYVYSSTIIKNCQSKIHALRFLVVLVKQVPIVSTEVKYRMDKCHQIF